MSSGIFSATDISASGMAAERLRMEVVANNLANAHTTRAEDGGPYRRRQVVFEAVLDDARGGGGGGGGVRVLGVQPDNSKLPRIFQPGHPDADADGMVTVTNVSPAVELVDLITASRSYEANLKALTAFRQMAQQALSLLRK